MKKYFVVMVCLCIALVNCWIVSSKGNSIPLTLGMESVESLAVPEWSSEYKYQAFGKCGTDWAYKCVKCKTGEYCSHYSCLAECN